MNMMHTPAADSEDIIDKRIVKLEYRNYDLVARYWEYGYLGKIWKNRKAIEEVDAVDDQGIDDLVRVMKEHVDKQIEKKCQVRKSESPPNAAELLSALRAVAHKLSAVERLILKMHAACRDGEIDMEKLQKLCGYGSNAAVLMTYCNIAQRLCDEVPWMPRQKVAYPALTILVKQLSRDQQQLVLKKEALKALSQWSGAD